MWLMLLLFFILKIWHSMFSGGTFALLFYRCLQLCRYLCPGHKLDPVSGVGKSTISVVHGYRFWFVFHLISHFVFLKNGIKNKQRNNMKNDPKNSIFQKQLLCLFLMHFYFSFIFHPFFVFGFQVAEGRFGVVHSFSSFPIWQLHHSIHRSHYLMSTKIKIRHF